MMSTFALLLFKLKQALSTKPLEKEAHPSLAHAIELSQKRWCRLTQALQEYGPT